MEGMNGTNEWNEWMERMNGTNEWNEWMERMNGTNVWNEWNEWMNEWRNERTNEWMNEWRMSERMDEWVTRFCELLLHWANFRHLLFCEHPLIWADRRREQACSMDCYRRSPLESLGGPEWCQMGICRALAAYFPYICIFYGIYNLIMGTF